MKAVIIIRWVFAVIGGAQLVAAYFFYSSTQTFLETAQKTQGVVTDLVRSTSSDSTTYQPVVEFQIQEGRIIEFTSNSGSNPPSYTRGESVEVLYDPGRPEKARINGFFSLWGLPVIFGGLGAVFFLIGAGMIAYGRKRASDVQYLKDQGIPIVAKFQSVERNTSLRVNGRSPYRIHAQWTNPATNELHIFESENIWFDPSSHIDREIISVLIEQGNPEKYYMDISFLPKVAS